MITLPWLAYNLLFPISQVGKATIAVSTPTMNKTTWVSGFVNPDGPIVRLASPRAVILRADPPDPPMNDTSDPGTSDLLEPPLDDSSNQEISRTTRAMGRPPRSNTPFFNETTQFPRKVPAKPTPLPRPDSPATEPTLAETPNFKNEGQTKERRSSPLDNPGSFGNGRTQDHPWSMQGYDCDDPRGLQDVTYSRGEACIEKMKVRHLRNATIHVLQKLEYEKKTGVSCACLLYTSPSPRD